MDLQTWQDLTSIGNDVQAMVCPEAQFALPELEAVRMHDHQDGALALVLVPASNSTSHTPVWKQHELDLRGSGTEPEHTALAAVLRRAARACQPASPDALQECDDCSCLPQSALVGQNGCRVLEPQPPHEIDSLQASKSILRLPKSSVRASAASAMILATPFSDARHPTKSWTGSVFTEKKGRQWSGTLSGLSVCTSSFSGQQVCPTCN